MKLITCHCDDEIDRDLYIPFHAIEEVHTNADGSDHIIANGKVYYPRNNDNFFDSIITIGE